MKMTRYFLVFLFVLALASAAAAGKGYMGGGDGGGEPIDDGGGSGGGGGGGGEPVDEPGSDNTTRYLYGELMVILRYLGGETKNVPAVDADGDPVMTTGEWTDPATGIVYSNVPQQAWTTAPAVGGEPKLSEEFASYTVVDEATGEYIINPVTGTIYYPAPYPSQCRQPVADFERWGDISSKTGLDDNLLPLIMTYDANWARTECEVAPEIFIAAGETWDGVTYYKDIYYGDLIQEASFGRLNQGRSPEAVRQMAFDEAVRTINKAKNIVLDATGRLLLTTDVYDEFLTNPDGTPVFIETITKAIDSPLQNMAMYVKLMQDGHLITPAADRNPIDRSEKGGIPLSKILDLEEGPSKALRPTIDIELMEEFGLGHLVDASGITDYITYRDEEGTLQYGLSCPPGVVCEEWYGVMERTETDQCDAEDIPFAASFLAAAADKTAELTIDKIVYFNSIMGINQVVGYSEYDEETGEPAPGAVDYLKNPVYFDFGARVNLQNQYQRQHTFTQRGQVTAPAGGGHPAEYDGNVRVLVQQADPAVWVETAVPIFATIFGGDDFIGTDINGFTAMADDDLRVIEFTHTYQIPGLR